MEYDKFKDKVRRIDLEIIKKKYHRHVPHTKYTVITFLFCRKKSSIKFRFIKLSNFDLRNNNCIMLIANYAFTGLKHLGVFIISILFYADFLKAKCGFFRSLDDKFKSV